MAIIVVPQGQNRRVYVRVDAVTIDKAQRTAQVQVSYFPSKQASDAGMLADSTFQHSVADTQAVPVDFETVEGETQPRPIMSEPGTEWTKWFGPKTWKKDPFAQAYGWLKTLPTYDKGEDVLEEGQHA